MESQFAQVVQSTPLIIEAAAALCIGLGFVYAFAALDMAHVRRQVVSFIREEREDQEREALVVTRPEAPLHVAPRQAQA
jgi:hypothetical protein